MMSSASATTRVEKATSQLLIGPDWAMNLEICDIVNSDTRQTKDVLKAVKKRLQNKNPKIQFHSLTLLETMMKNCGEHVRFEVIQQDILQEMIKIVKKQTDMQVRDKVLLLLDSWQEAFGGPEGKYPQYYWAYVELKRSGIPFPRRPPDTPAIFTPPFTHPASSSSYPQLPYGPSSYASGNLNEGMQSVNGSLSLLDLNKIQTTMELLKDMLQALNPHDRAAVKDEIITDLVSQCLSNQQKIRELVSSTGDEELLGRALALNDSLQGVLAKHEAIASGSPLPVDASGNDLALQAPASPTPVEVNHVGNEEDADDEFSQIAQRESKPDSNTQNTDAEPPSPLANNALVPVDPLSPVSIERKEQDLIDLLSLTLSTNPTPPLEAAPPTTPAPSEDGSQLPASGQGNPFTQPYPVNQGYAPPYNSYAAPWSQSVQPPPQPQMYPYGYPTGPWRPAASAMPGTFAPAANQVPASPAPLYLPPASQPMQSFNSFGSGANNSPAASRPMQRFDSFGSRANNSLMVIPESQANANPKQKEASVATKPYYMPDNLFEDLMDVKNFSLGSKGNNRSTDTGGKSGQPMINGQK